MSNTVVKKEILKELDNKTDEKGRGKSKRIEILKKYKELDEKCDIALIKLKS